MDPTHRGSARYVLAIDQSTSGTKALLVAPPGTMVCKYAKPHRQIYPQPGWVEHDAEEIYQNTLAVVRELLREHPQEAQDLLCLSITNQRETFVVFDRASGHPLYPAIVWQCRRGETVCRQLQAEGHAELVQSKTGLVIDTYFPAPKLSWLMEQEPEIARKLRAGEALFGTIDTYLIYRLTQGRVFATDHTNASRTLWDDISTLRWDPSLCDLFGIPIAALPEVRESSACFGKTDLEGSLSVPIPICGVMGDSQAAAFAERCFHPGNAKVTFGTGSSILLNVGEKMLHSVHGNVTTIAYVHAGQPTYAFEGMINYSGAIVAWLRDQLKLISDPAETEALALAVPDNGGVYLVPAFVGLNAPYWRPELKAAIIGLTPASTREHVVRAALEAITFRIRELLALMEADAGLLLKQIAADGGMVGNRFLMQTVADVTRRTVRVAQFGELSSLGVVYAGLLGLKWFSSLLDLEQLPQNTIDYTPIEDATQVDRYYAEWQEAVRRLL